MPVGRRHGYGCGRPVPARHCANAGTRAQRPQDGDRALCGRLGATFGRGLPPCGPLVPRGRPSSGGLTALATASPLASLFAAFFPRQCRAGVFYWPLLFSLASCLLVLLAPSLPPLLCHPPRCAFLRPGCTPSDGSHIPERQEKCVQLFFRGYGQVSEECLFVIGGAGGIGAGLGRSTSASPRIDRRRLCGRRRARGAADQRRSARSFSLAPTRLPGLRSRFRGAPAWMPILFPLATSGARSPSPYAAGAASRTSFMAHK